MRVRGAGVRAAEEGRALLVLAVYIGAVLVVGAALAYPAWRLIELVAGPSEFHRVVLRCLELVAVAGVWVWLRLRGRRGAAAWGLGGGTRRLLREVGQGWVAGLAMLGLVAAALVLLEVRIPRDPGTAPALLSVLTRGVIIGVTVALIEELWFRGGLYSAIGGAGRRAGVTAPRRAIIATSVLYAAVHFLRPEGTVPADAVHWGTAFALVFHSFAGLGDAAILDSFVALAAAGLVLGLARERTGRIGACLGLHAGWVAAIYATRKLTAPNPEAAAAPLVGTYDGVIGWLAAGLFAAAAAYLALGPSR